MTTFKETWIHYGYLKGKNAYDKEITKNTTKNIEKYDILDYDYFTQ